MKLVPAFNFSSALFLTILAVGAATLYHSGDVLLLAALAALNLFAGLIQIGDSNGS